jgi:hypothetical protein
VVEHGNLRVALAVKLAINENLHDKSRVKYFKTEGEANVNLRDSGRKMIIFPRS